ncbi:MAG: YidC/Oxa1 family membrane protein insertase [Anaerolineae bacterium]
MWNEIIIYPFTNVLLWIYNVIGHNFGIAIILFTILIKLITWPLNAQQLKSAKVMQDLQNDKEWQDIQKKYAKDREKLAQEQMRIYKERGINPLASCLPTLIQFPIIIGLYQSIIHALAATPLGLLQLAQGLYPFLNTALLIPLNSKFLWMDLGKPEGIALPGLNVPFLPYGFPTLAIIVAITTYLQTKLTMPPATAGGNDQGAMMNSMMGIYMPLLLGYFALNFASGLAVYFITSNVLGIVQYASMGRVNWNNVLPGWMKKPEVKPTQKQIAAGRKKS